MPLHRKRPKRSVHQTLTVQVPGKGIRIAKSDEHAPPEIRAVAPRMNWDTFYDVFEIKTGDAMYIAPEKKRVRIW